MPPRGKTADLSQMYVADFETCDAWVPRGDEVPDQRVWLAGRKNLKTMQSEYFTSLDDFMNCILGRGANINTEYAFHNLKFDGSYVVPWLFKNGYEVVRARAHERGQFSVLIDERNMWYSITIRVTKKRKVTLWDSLKLFPCPLEYLPQEYGTPTQKIREDEEFYQRIRLKGHQPSKEEKQYLENDLQVLAETLREHINICGLRFKKTQAGQAFYNFSKHFPTWKMRFPPLDLEIDQQIRPAYWGGLSYVNPRHAGKDRFNIGSYDINSSYPGQLANKPLPYGEIVKKTQGQEPDHTKFWVGELLAIFDLKQDCLPCIPTRAITEGRPVVLDKWLTNSGGVVRMVTCGIDWVTILQSYDIKVIRWEWAIHWAQKRHREIASFVAKNNTAKVEHRRKAKTEQDPRKRQEHLTQANRAKIDNNSFYGKFGEDIIKHRKTPTPLEKGGVRYLVDEPDIVAKNRRRFLPVAIATTAWGRRQLVEMGNLLGEHFLYCDTDSIHYLREGGEAKVKKAEQEGIIKIDPLELGAWKHEGNFERGRYLRAKCYMEDKEVTCAGLPADKHSGRASKVRSCCTWENFHIGLIIKGGNGKLRTVRTATGNKLVPTDFEIQRHPALLNTYKTEEEQARQIRMEFQKEFRRAVMSLGGVYDPDFESLPRWCKRKKGHALGDLLGELAEMGYPFEDENDFYESLQSN